MLVFMDLVTYAMQAVQYLWIKKKTYLSVEFGKVRYLHSTSQMDFFFSPSIDFNIILQIIVFLST